MNYESRSLLDLCYHRQCYLQVDGVCVNRDTVPCHSNQLRDGKGKSIKAHDVYAVPGCPACHYEIDQGKRLSREERFAIWDSAWRRWMLDLFRGGLVKVA